MNTLIRSVSTVLIFATICVMTRSLLGTTLLRTLDSFFIFYGLWATLLFSVIIQILRCKKIPKLAFKIDMLSAAVCFVVYSVFGVLSFVRLASV